MPVEKKTRKYRIGVQWFLCLLAPLFFLQSKAAADYSYLVHLDPSDSVSTEKFRSINFKRVEDLGLGFYKGSIWVKVKVKNYGPPNSFILYTYDSFQRNYHFYEIAQDSLRNIPPTTTHSGQSDDRYFNFREPNFRLDLKLGETKEFLLHVTSDGRIVNATPEVILLTDFVALMRRMTMFNVIFFGLVGFVFLINILLAKILNNKIYLLYGTCIFFNTFFMLGFDGSLFDIGISNFMVDHLIFISIRLWVISFLIFSSMFLGLKESSPGFLSAAKKYVLIVTVGLTLYQLIFLYSSIPVLHKLENLVGFTWLILLGIGVFKSPKTKIKERKSYLIVLGVFATFIALALSTSHGGDGILSPSSFYKVGSLLEFIGFTSIMINFFGKRQKESSQKMQVLIQNKSEAEKRLESSTQRLNELETKIKELRAKNEQPASSPSFSITNQLAIFKLLESNISNEKDWVHFREEYLRLAPDFLSKLVQDTPNLTKSEIRLLILLKIGYTQKEIAELLAISPESVKKARQRTRKRLGLPRELTIGDYLKSL